MGVLSGMGVTPENFEIIDIDGNNILETIKGIRNIEISAHVGDIVTARVEVPCSSVKVCGVTVIKSEYCPFDKEVKGATL